MSYQSAYDPDASEFAQEFMFNSIRTHQLNRMAVPAYAKTQRELSEHSNNGDAFRLQQEQWRRQVLANRAQGVGYAESIIGAPTANNAATYYPFNHIY